MTTRRTVLKAAAWTAPAVTIAAAAPAYATSTSPEPVCEVKGWHTNHGHKGHDKPEPGTHHFHLSVACTSLVRAVWIAGKSAAWHPSGVWTVTGVRGGVHQPVTVLTDTGTVSRTVRFQPEKETNR